MTTQTITIQENVSKETIKLQKVKHSMYDSEEKSLSLELINMEHEYAAHKYLLFIVNIYLLKLFI